MEYIKISDNEIEVSETKNIVDKKVYSYESLLEMKANLEAERERVIGNIDEKLKEVDALISECIKLGIKEKVVEPIEIKPRAD